MTNLIYTNEIHNENVKERFLARYSEASRKSHERLFLVSALTEEKANKDLYNFNLSEIKDILTDLKPLSLAASRQNASNISVYIRWAIGEGLRSNNINPLEGQTTTEWLEQFVIKTIPPYISERQLQLIENLCENYQDKIIFRLLFEGVQGKGCAELINLKKEDVNFETGMLQLKDIDNSIRELKVSHRAIDFIKAALQETTYLKKNGKMSEDNYLKRDFDLVMNDFVIRNNLTRTDNIDQIDKHTIYRRIKVIRDLMGFPRLTVKTITASGMIKMGKDLLERDGQLEKKQYQEICERFDIKTNWSTLKPVVNLENIKKYT